MLNLLKIIFIKLSHNKLQYIEGIQVSTISKSESQIKKYKPLFCKELPT